MLWKLERERKQQLEREEALTREALEEVVNRLRASKEKMEDADYQIGHGVGSRWALQVLTNWLSEIRGQALVSVVRLLWQIRCSFKSTMMWRIHAYRRSTMIWRIAGNYGYCISTESC